MHFCYSRKLKTLIFKAFILALLAQNCNQIAENEVEYSFQGKITGLGNGHLPAQQAVTIPCDTNFTGIYGNSTINGGDGVTLTTTPYPENFKGTTSIAEIRNLISQATNLPVTFSPPRQIKGRITGLTTFNNNVSQRAFFVQDATAGIFVFADNNVIAQNLSELGREITMTVSQGNKFNGSLQITGTVSSITITNSSEPLYVKDISDDSIIHEGELVRFCGYVFNNQKHVQFSVSGRPSVYFGGSRAGNDDLYILDFDFVTVLGPLTSFQGKTQINLSQEGAYEAKLSTYVKKHDRQFLKIYQQYPEPDDVHHRLNLNISITFDKSLPALTMSQFFTIRQGSCAGPIVSTGEPTATDSNRKFTYTLTSLLPFTTYATCVSASLYDTENKYLQQPIAFTWQTGEANYNKVVISQFYVHGGNSGATYKQDFVEIFNRSNTTVNLDGWSLQYQGGTNVGQYPSVFNIPNISLGAGKYYLIRCASSGNNGADITMADNTGCTINFSTTAGKIALVKTTKPIWHNTPIPTGYISDLVGYGTVNQSEGSSTAAPGTSTRSRRASNGCTDSDANNSDFANYNLTGNQTSDLRNQATPANICP